MHNSSMLEMKKFVNTYLSRDEELNILDVGSYNVNGCYRGLFNSDKWTYTGLDISNGPNVDVVAKDLYNWFEDIELFDVVISGQCLEHVEDTHRWIMEVEKSVKIGGIVCIIAPWTHKEHRYPIDCWRIFPDGMKFLLSKICNLEIIEVYKNNFIDCVGIARKSPISTIP